MGTPVASLTSTNRVPSMPRSVITRTTASRISGFWRPALRVRLRMGAVSAMAVDAPFLRCSALLCTCSSLLVRRTGPARPPPGLPPPAARCSSLIRLHHYCTLIQYLHSYLYLYEIWFCVQCSWADRPLGLTAIDLTQLLEA